MLVELKNKQELFISVLGEQEEVDHASQDLLVKEAPQSKFLELYGTIPEIWNKSSAVALYGIKDTSLHHYWTLKMVQKKGGMRIRKWGQRDDR
jgi:hypothetical protein